MADNWANFTNVAGRGRAAQPGGAGADQPQGQAQAPGGGGMEDDWGDFGGFEEATPPPPELGHQVPAPGVEARPSPWASFAIASVQNPSAGQPDLLMAQAQTQPPLQPQIDPPFADPVPQLASAAAPELTSQAEATRQHAQAQAVAPLQNQPIKNSLDDVDVRLDDDMGAVGGAPPVENHNAPPADAEPLDEVDMLRNEPDEYPPSQRFAKRSSSTMEVFAAELTGKVARLEERLSGAEREKIRLQKIREDLSQQLEALDLEVKGHQKEAKEQRQLYEQVQARHGEEIEELRKAGHDALAIIVEEYKELCKCTVLQQQEASEKQLQVAITKEADRCKEILQSQHDRLAEVLEEERDKNEERMKASLQEQLDSQKAMLVTCLREEREKNLLELHKALKEEHQKNHDVLQSALEEERSKGREMLEIQRAEAARSLEEERQRHRESLEKSLEEDRRRSKEAIRAALDEEREKQREAIQQAVTKSREGMEEYTSEQKRLDSAVRHRSMASLDLFLEGARQQLKSLMEDRPTVRLADKPAAHPNNSP